MCCVFDALHWPCSIKHNVSFHESFSYTIKSQVETIVPIQKIPEKFIAIKTFHCDALHVCCTGLTLFCKTFCKFFIFSPLI